MTILEKMILLDLMTLIIESNMLSKKNIKILIVHCSDTPDDENLSAIDIHKMHLSFGWDGIGYHKVICRDGNIQNGRPEFWIGAHVYGKNSQSLGVCLIGRHEFTEQQFLSLEHVLLDWKSKYHNVTIQGHRDTILTDKTCPNFDVKNWCKNRSII